jgi:Ca-activated chloride channel homolog
VNFGHPKVLWLTAVLLPLLGIFLWATWRRRQALVRYFVQNKSLAELTLGSSTAKLKLRRLLLFFAVAALLLTTARPQWGFAWEEATQRGRDIIVAIDTSRSMLAQDLQPNRLTRAKLAALDLLKIGKFDRFGLVAFSGSAFLQCPLTFDDEAFRQSVQILQPGIIPQGGTALSQAIETAQRAFSEDGDENHRILVLFTDGEDHEEGVMETAREAADAGMKIFTVGVGTPAGELLRIQDEAGRSGFLKDDAGNVVKSRLNQALLQEIASKAGGMYFQLQGANVMEALYQKGLAPLPTSERSAKLLKRFKEQFYWPLSIAIILLVVEAFIPEGRRTARSRQAASVPAPINAVAAALTLLLLPSAFAASKAERHYNAGDYKSALTEYQELIQKKPSDPRLHYNAGAAAYHANKFDLALKEFQAAVASPDIDLQQQSFYNLANAEYRLGEANPNVQERTALWEEAVQHYEAALKLRPVDRDAEFNRDFVRKKLEELKEEQQKQKPEEKQDDKKQEDEQKDQEQKKDDQKQDQQSDQNKNSEEQKSDQQKQQQENQSSQEQQEQNQEQQQKEREKEKEKGDAQPQQKGDNKENQQAPDAEGQGEAAQLGKMTPAQAKQLLDSQKNEEKALIFLPPERKTRGQNRTFKDW